MWPRSFEARLTSWHQLRQSVVHLPLDQCLSTINTWWFECPWRAYYLHWDDQETWPDPWQLLDDNQFCDLARALGILYTISLLDRSDIQDADLVDYCNHNLVLVQDEKYILNWERDQIVNINLPDTKPSRRLSQQQLRKQIK